MSPLRHPRRLSTDSSTRDRDRPPGCLAAGDPGLSPVPAGPPDRMAACRGWPGCRRLECVLAGLDQPDVGRAA
jgi:hypothetical protein